MRLRDRYRSTPPSVSGRLRHDVVLNIADAAVSALWALSGATRKLNLPPATEGLLGLTVIERRVVAHDQDVVALRLASTDGEPLPRWHPGSHLDIHLPSGKVRQYSLSGDPDDRDSYRIAVRRIADGGGGSIEMHELPVGARVTTHGPRNAFPLTVPGYGSPARRCRFIAGGIGITPILPMLAYAERLGVDWSMVYTGRSRDTLPFLDELSRFGHRVEVRTDDVSGIPTAAALLGDCPEGTTVYACGPAPMLTAIRAELAGRDDVELHFERFAEPPVVDGEEFTVTVASTGKEVVVGAAETLLAALQRSGVATPYSCRQGFCGTCRTRVLAGAVDHRDTLLTTPERENGLMLVCVSRAQNGERIILDL
ncbi:PDR/VanB family oxidoreductase [Mycobacterium sp. 1274761.0]|uniref:PDR/VanB family oxidoreductase n=1 Tax=Mycobacterium sp. 1274761.0 TaxID=1834077 RepID=UPI0007FC17BB|nr:PDR/VanB family oxidoreductase [Mycobacterium sp. 1274761.0]OBK78764.1 ferredoxin [Mycobacterium sp. 1274761.0]